MTPTDAHTLADAAQLFAISFTFVASAYGVRTLGSFLKWILE